MDRPLTAAERAAAPARLRQAAQAFESQAFAQLLQPVFASADPSRGRFGGGAAEAQWRPMLVDAVAKQAVRAGHGLGLSDAILRALLQRQDAPQPEEPSR
ncbi:rod-binding protein [Dankookia sp. GCM10030260]|uniref:rod-binding protein n=1 Tax=Dankookia sp. GCM10030260 TaxID=3273390 RepID=UPI003607EE68